MHHPKVGCRGLGLCPQLPACPVQMFEFYERVSGARMHAAYIRPGGVHQVSARLPAAVPALPSAATGGQRQQMGTLPWPPALLGSLSPSVGLPGPAPGAYGRHLSVF